MGNVGQNEPSYFLKIETKLNLILLTLPGITGLRQPGVHSNIAFDPSMWALQPVE